MIGEKRIELGSSIKFSFRDSGGHNRFEVADFVTVRAPGIEQYRIHQMMRSYVAKVRPALVENFARMSAVSARMRKESGLDDVPEPEPQAPVGDEPDGADERDALEWMALGLGEDTYPAFVEKVKAALTGNPRLLSIGPMNGPVDDGIWYEIASNCGMAAVDKILSDFVGFFFGLGGTSSPARSGPASSPTSPSPSPASSPTKPRRISRSTN